MISDAWAGVLDDAASWRAWFDEAADAYDRAVPAECVGAALFVEHFKRATMRFRERLTAYNAYMDWRATHA